MCQKDRAPTPKRAYGNTRTQLPSNTYQRNTVKSNRAKHMDRQSFRKLFNYVHVFRAQTLNSCRSAQISIRRQSKHTAIHSFIQNWSEWLIVCIYDFVSTLTQPIASGSVFEWMTAAGITHSIISVRSTFDRKQWRGQSTLYIHTHDRHAYGSVLFNAMCPFPLKFLLLSEGTPFEGCRVLFLRRKLVLSMQSKANCSLFSGGSCCNKKRSRPIVRE